jgi:hypothetical protein
MGTTSFGQGNDPPADSRLLLRTLPDRTSLVSRVIRYPDRESDEVQRVDCRLELVPRPRLGTGGTITKRGASIGYRPLQLN